MSTTTPTEDLDDFLKSTDYLDADEPAVMAKAKELTEGCTTDEERLSRIYYYVRDLPYDILDSFRYLALGETRASDVIKHGVAFCMGKASSFVALARAAHIPARVAFQALHSPEMEFLSPEVREVWGGENGRPLPWHSLGEAYINGKWLKLDATIDASTASALGKPYTVEFDGHSHIPTVEGPIIRENGSYADYPAEVAEWYLEVSKRVMAALDSDRERAQLAADDELWAGPNPVQVAATAVA